MAHLSHRRGTGVAQAWHRCGTGVALVSHRCGTGVAQAWHRCRRRFCENSFVMFFPDCFVSEQHPPAGPHEPGGHARAHPRLRPLPGPCGLVQQLQAPGLFRGEGPSLQHCPNLQFCRPGVHRSVWCLCVRSGQLTSAETAPSPTNSPDSTSA